MSKAGAEEAEDADGGVRDRYDAMQGGVYEEGCWRVRGTEENAIVSAMQLRSFYLPPVVLKRISPPRAIE
jgi:hypothetical protein